MKQYQWQVIEKVILQFTEIYFCNYLIENSSIEFTFITAEARMCLTENRK